MSLRDTSAPTAGTIMPSSMSASIAGPSKPNRGHASMDSPVPNAAPAFCARSTARRIYALPHDSPTVDPPSREELALLARQMKVRIVANTPELQTELMLAYAHLQAALLPESVRRATSFSELSPAPPPSDTSGGAQASRGSTPAPLSFPASVLNQIKIEPKPIGRGTFGVVYRGTFLNSGLPCAVKLECFQSRSSVAIEARCIERFCDSGFPKLLGEYVDESLGQGRAVIVMPLYGPSLQDCFEACGPFSMKTILMIADQMLRRLNYLHSKCLVHRDLKPANILTPHASESSTSLKLIDFGLCTYWIDPTTKLDVPYSRGSTFVGTPQFASVSAHRGERQLPRDDLQSLLYVLVYLYRGSLPWSSSQAHRRTGYLKSILNQKATITAQELLGDMPTPFHDFFNMIALLKAWQRKPGKSSTLPEYARYRKLFRDYFLSLGYAYDLSFDWCLAEKRTLLLSQTRDRAHDPQVHSPSFASTSISQRMPSLRPSLTDLYFSSHPLSPKALLMIVDQMLLQLEAFHERSAAHGHLHPSLIFTSNKDKTGGLNLMDPVPISSERFTFLFPQISYFASSRVLTGCEPSPLDDLESLSYILIYLRHGTLPWLHINSSDARDQAKQILAVREALSLDELFGGMHCVFRTFLAQVQALSPDLPPDYASLLRPFRVHFVRSGYVYDLDYTTSKYIDPASVVHSGDEALPDCQVNRLSFPRSDGAFSLASDCSAVFSAQSIDLTRPDALDSDEEQGFQATSSDSGEDFAEDLRQKAAASVARSFRPTGLARHSHSSSTDSSSLSDDCSSCCSSSDNDDVAFGIDGMATSKCRDSEEGESERECEVHEEENR
mmetsp:Transcript_38674/g.97383  ORF Transcript_38674/g.97383 Transcript_38674/m.97383 type:complete len:839 (-) Transcript_38674:1696-4212(-)